MGVRILERLIGIVAGLLGVALLVAAVARSEVQVALYGAVPVMVLALIVVSIPVLFFVLLLGGTGMDQVIWALAICAASGRPTRCTPGGERRCDGTCSLARRPPRRGRAWRARAPAPTARRPR